jgi:hypothetical protein
VLTREKFLLHHLSRLSSKVLLLKGLFVRDAKFFIIIRVLLLLVIVF